MKTPWKIYILILVISINTPSSAFAHPHMWIRGQILPEVGSPGLEGIHVIWNIDELTSADLNLYYDSNQNGELSSDEVEALRLGAFEHLSENDYYLLVDVDGKLSALSEAEDFLAQIEDGHLIYYFFVPLQKPIPWDNLKSLQIYYFDVTYFIDFRPEDISPVTVSYENYNIDFQPAHEKLKSNYYGMIEVNGLKVNSVKKGGVLQP